MDLFAGLAVTDRSVAVAWYEQILGAPPAFFPNEREAVFEVAPHRYIYIELRPGSAGHGFVTLFLADYDDRLARISARGLRPASVETYDNGVRKAIFRDPDGNEIGFGGSPGMPRPV